MAEIRVPAWPIPIHQTKLMIAKPQPLGILIPQTPTPFVNSQTAPAARPCRQTEGEKKTERPSQRDFPLEDDAADLIGNRGKAMAFVDDGTDVNLIGNLDWLRHLAFPFRVVVRNRQRRIWIANIGQIRGTRARIQLAEQ